MMFPLLVVTTPFLVGCSEQGLSPCHDVLEVGITAPLPNTAIAQGLPMVLEAKVQNLCGTEVLDGAIYSITSSLDGELGGEEAFLDGFYSFTGNAMMSAGEHKVTLRVVADSGLDAEDSVTVQVLENTPPTITLTSPGPDEADWFLDDGAPIIALVDDEHEDLDTLALSWTLNGMPLEGGPENADETGTAAWTLTDGAAGCHEIAVTVTDVTGQSATDSAEFVLWTQASELDAYRWWVDEDDDGWGAPGTETLSCESPEGSVAFSVEEDCDDLDETVHPGAADYCNDGIDSDCDAVTPTGCYPWGEMPATQSDAYLSGSFYDVAAVGDVTGDGVDDIAVGNLNGYTYVLPGPAVGAMSLEGGLTSWLTGGVDSFRGVLGYSIAGGQDFDGDGFSDLALGNPSWAYACSGNYTVVSGRAYLWSGGDDFPTGTIEDVVVDGIYAEPGKSLAFHTNYSSGCGYTLSHVGTSMHLLPDMDGDGLADLAIAATYNESSHGSVWIVLSSQSDDLVSGLFDDTNHRLELVGPDESAQLGVDLGSADVDGDGLSDLLVSSISSTDPDDTGTVYVVFARDLPSTQTQMDIRSLASITFTGASPGAGAGTSVAGVGDLDGDGDDEFVVVAPGENDGAGVVYLVPGFYEVNGEHVLGDELSSATSPNATGTLVFAGAEGDALNDAVLAGDLNNDGHPDLAIGAPGHNGSGAVYVVYGGPDHWGDWWDSSTGAPQEPIQLDESALNEEHTARIYSEQGWEGFGSDVEGATDLNNDGIDDLLVGNSGSESMVRVFHGGGS